MSPLSQLISAIHFAAIKHRTQRRKGAHADPYINHPIAVAELLARVAGVDDAATLIAALLHDTLEDTDTTAEQIEQQFGSEVRRLVEEVSDDKTLPKAERKRRQVEHAPQLSPKARLIKIADKISNLSELTQTDPAGWSTERKREYIDWGEQVVARIRGSNGRLEQLFDQVAQEKRSMFQAP